MHSSTRIGLVLGAVALCAGSPARAQSVGTARTLLAPAQQPAQQVDHRAEALKHAQMAVDEGTAGRVATLMQHAEEALGHAQAAQKQGPSPELDSAIVSLKLAMDKGKAGNAAEATKAAQAAVDRLKGQP